MTEATIAAPAPAAAPTPAPAPAAPSVPSFGGGSVPTSNVDPGKFALREDYAAALLTEKLSAQPAAPDEPPMASVEEAVVLTEPPQEAPEAVVETPAAPEDEDFQLEPE